MDIPFDRVRKIFIFPLTGFHRRALGNQSGDYSLNMIIEGFSITTFTVEKEQLEPVIVAFSILSPQAVIKSMGKLDLTP